MGTTGEQTELDQLRTRVDQLEHILRNVAWMTVGQEDGQMLIVKAIGGRLAENWTNLTPPRGEVDAWLTSSLVTQVFDDTVEGVTDAPYMASCYCGWTSPREDTEQAAQAHVAPHITEAHGEFLTRFPALTEGVAA